MSIDTGCSASMVALHQACQTIWSGASDISVVAGANALLSPDMFISMSSLGFVLSTWNERTWLTYSHSALGKDGRCFSWDQRANGYGRGEGAAVLFLKPLDAAIEAGDRIHSVIRASGLNHDGKTASLWSPSMDAQIQLIRDTYALAGMDVRDTAYVEAHVSQTK